MVKSAKTSKSKAKPIELTKGSTLRFAHDTQTGMLQGIPRSARCVQRFDDSLNSAIHITYRISLRSSSMREPRDPLLKLCSNDVLHQLHSVQVQLSLCN